MHVFLPFSNKFRNLRVYLLGDLGPSQSQKLAHEMRFFLTLINSSSIPSTIDVGNLTLFSSYF